MVTFDYAPIIKASQNRRYQWAAALAVLLVILLWSSSIRLSNWDFLTDQTSGEKIPLALDPFYFLRLAETIQAEGSLPEYDPFRYPATDIGYILEIMPHVVVGMHDVARLFGDYTLQEVHVFSPVAFFFIGMILFFFLVYVLTNSKLTALISSAFLAFVPAYLYRTMAGFADHEAIGMVGFFAAMLFFAISLTYITKKHTLTHAGLFGIGAGAITALSVAFWGGVANFLFMIFPLSFLIIWFASMRRDTSFMKPGIAFYLPWIISSTLFGVFFRYGPLGIFERFMLGTQGLASLFVLGFIIVDAIVILNRERLSFIRGRYRELYSLGGVVALGAIALTVLGKNVFSIISEIWFRIFHPWGGSRVSLTVAENTQPYLVDWISQSGTFLFWMFFGGTILVGFEFAKGFTEKRNRILFGIGWSIMVISILFSRISSSSLLNGINFISQTFFIGGLILAVALFTKAYFNDRLHITPVLSIMASWTVFMLIAGKASQRIFFVVAPLVCFMAGYFIVQLWRYLQKSRDDIVKPIVAILLVVAILGGAHSLFGFGDQPGFVEIISSQAAGTGPSAHFQWQAAMQWVRDNTGDQDIFVHWWDYGYWVQGLGERRTLTDGGHGVKYWDHLIGRYLLTTPEPGAALSFMKTHNVSYLLIDPTDLGKYPAYSRIGSDVEGNDRFAVIPSTFQLDSSQTQETSDGVVSVYRDLQGRAYPIDEDIMYNNGEQEIFLPAGRASIAAIIWKTLTVEGGTNFEQPVGVYFYNNQRYDIPLRYAYVNDELLDFGGGVEGVLRIIPSFDGQQIHARGASLYLSPKVASGLFAQLYLLEDAFENYETITLAHSQDDSVISQMRNQGIDVGDFVYFGGFRGPIKIWAVDYPEGLLEREEFLRLDGEYAALDGLTFY